jgi:predicted metalloprotease
MSFSLLRLAAAAATAAALFAGCAPIPNQQPPAPVGTAPIEGVDQAGMKEDERVAITATATFWKRRFTQLFGRPYTPPKVAGAYLGTNGPTCGGQRSVPFNAFYCTAEDFVAWDQNLMAAGYKQIGDAWVYLIIAHEWGHAIQARLDRGQVSVAAELQADCLAGATLLGATQDRTIRFEAGDGEELAKTLAAVADDFPWTSESDHGDARQRINAFNLGLRGGVAECT